MTTTRLRAATHLPGLEQEIRLSGPECRNASEISSSLGEDLRFPHRGSFSAPPESISGTNAERHTSDPRHVSKDSFARTKTSRGCIPGAVARQSNLPPIG